MASRNTDQMELEGDEDQEEDWATLQDRDGKGLKETSGSRGEKEVSGLRTK